MEKTVLDSTEAILRHMSQDAAVSLSQAMVGEFIEERDAVWWKRRVFIHEPDTNTN